MVRSPCKDHKRRLPVYKSKQRGLPKGSSETLHRRRYEVRGDGIPCRPVEETAPGRTRCYAPTEHSKRRKTCTLLVDPDQFPPEFKPGLYLYGGPRMAQHGVDFVCNAMDWETTFQDVQIDTRATINRTTGALHPGKFDVAVLGPYVDPVTERLTLRCVQMSAFDVDQIGRGATGSNLVTFGQMFSTNQDYEAGFTPVPTAAMLHEFQGDLESAELRLRLDDGDQELIKQFAELSNILVNIRGQLRTRDTALNDLRRLCDGDANDFERRARLMARLFFELALYSRRWAGPDRPFPISTLPAVVGTAANPLSEKLRGRYAIPSVNGVKLHKADNAGYGTLREASQVDEYGMLRRMQQACGESILMIFRTFTPAQKRVVRATMALGYQMYEIDGSGFWQSFDEVNRTNGNPPVMGGPFQLDVFQMYFGTTVNPELYAHSSVQGTGSYCVQIASSMLGRTIITLLPYLYKNRPTWAAHEGIWKTLHT